MRPRTTIRTGEKIWLQGDGERQLVPKKRQRKDPRTGENKEPERNAKASENGDMYIIEGLSLEYRKEVHE